MADLEAVLADVSYLMAMEKSKCTPAARASKKIILPDPRYVIVDSNGWVDHSRPVGCIHCLFFLLPLSQRAKRNAEILGKDGRRHV